MIADDLKKSVLKLASEGKLTNHFDTDINIEDYLLEVKNNEAIKNKNVNGKFIYDINCPDYWRVVKLGEICGIYGGKRIPAGRKLTKENTGHKYIRVADMNDMTIETDNIMFVPSDIYDSIKRYTISKNDIYITVAGTIGKVGTVPDELDNANLTENADKLVFKKINKKWLFYQLQTPIIKKQISDMTTKVGQPKLAIKRISNIEIPLPPIEEQQRIVNKIEDLFAKLDEIKPIEEELNKIKISFPNEMRKSILDYAFNGKLIKSTSKWNIKSDDNIYKKVWQVTIWDKKFTNVPKNWQPKTIKYNYLLASEMKRLEDENGDVYLLSTGQYEGYTTEEKAGTYLATGEVVAIPWGGSPSVKYYKGKFVTSDNRIATSSNKKILLNKFLYYYFESKITFLDTIYRGTSLRHPKMKEVLNMDIPIPSIEEQQKIVDRIEELLPLCDDIERIVNE